MPLCLGRHRAWQMPEGRCNKRNTVVSALLVLVGGYKTAVPQSLRSMQQSKKNP